MAEQMTYHSIIIFPGGPDQMQLQITAGMANHLFDVFDQESQRVEHKIEASRDLAEKIYLGARLSELAKAAMMFFDFDDDSDPPGGADGRGV